MAIAPTQRDLALIRFIASRRSALLSDVKERYYATNPFDDEPNADPEKACRRRLGALARAGYVRLGFDFDGRVRRRVVTLGPASESITGVSSHRRIPARNRAHHIRTQEAITLLERIVAAGGGRVVDVRFEHDVRAQDFAGRRTRRGDRMPAAPDAVLQAELRAGDGSHRVVDLAIEYVTGKYTDADIVAKHRSFKRFDGAYWFADNARTAERVLRLTGASCTTLC